MSVRVSLAALAFASFLFSGEDVATAQVWQRIGIGAAIGMTEPHDKDVDSALVIGGRGGLAPEPGFGFDASLGWFSADLFDVRGTSEARIGELRVRPLMGGIGYTWMTAGGRLATTASLTAGVSFNGADLDDGLAASVGGAALDVGNSFAIRPGIEAEFFVTRKFAVTAGLGYLYTRPEITYSSPTERITDHWNASAFALLAGVVVYPFR
jgi:hypothetical protein